MTTSLISSADLDYMLNQNDAQVESMVAGMMSLVRDSELKIDAMEKQPWYKRLAGAVFGTNKATKEEIARNHDRLSVYTMEALSKLYERSRLNEHIIVNLGAQINEIYSSHIALEQSHIELKQMLGAFAFKLNAKIESIDKYNLLFQDITLGKYGNSFNPVQLYRIMAQFDLHILKDDHKLDNLKSVMKKEGLFPAGPVAIGDYLNFIVDMDDTHLGCVYLEVQGHIDSIIGQLTAGVIQYWNYMPKTNRALLNRKTVIQQLLDNYDIDSSVEISFEDVYEEIIEHKQARPLALPVESGSCPTRFDSGVPAVARGYEPVESGSRPTRFDRGKIVDVLRTGKVLVSDGAWGTFLYQKGLKPGESPDAWCLSRFGDVVDIVKRYADAGADMVESNSFGGNIYKLEHYGYADRVSEINEAAANASRKGAGPDKYVIASIGPTGKMLVTEEVTEEEMYDAFKEQAVALEKGGADAVCIETMSDTEEASLAIKATKENTKLEIITTFSFDKTIKGDYKTMMGTSPARAVKEALDAGSDIVGTNCGNGIERMIDIVKEMKAAYPKALILVHANAGMPQNIGGKDVFPETPEMMAKQIPDLIDAGANIIGGCCGTTPAHIKAIKEVVMAHNKKNGK